jgi:hypothetical protein
LAALKDLNPVGRKFQDLNPFGPPFPAAVLLRCNPNFLARTKAIRVAFVFLADGHIFPKDNIRVRNLHPPEHMIPSLNIDPAPDHRLIRWRIDDPALKGSINGPEGNTQEREHKQNGGNSAAHPI